MQEKVLNLKIPTQNHKNIKGFAVLNGENLIPFANQILIDASNDKEILEKALKNLRSQEAENV